MTALQTQETPDLDATFFALADPTRRAMLQRLARGEANVNELAEPFAMSQPAISKHLKVLEAAGLVSVRQEGRRRPRRLEPQPLEAATDWIERYRELWETNHRRLDALLRELQETHELQGTPELKETQELQETHELQGTPELQETRKTQNTRNTQETQQTHRAGRPGPPPETPNGE